MNKYLEILKMKNWLKNIIIFLPFYIEGFLFSSGRFLSLIIPFIALCLISSAGYILNDICDIEEDRLHPKKKHRPFASGTIRPITGSLILSILIIFSFFLYPSIYLLLLFLIDLIYNVKFRHVPYLDCTVLSSKYPVRLMMGYDILAISPDISLLLIVFFLAIILAIFKRIGEVGIYSRSVMKYYTKNRLYSFFRLNFYLLGSLILIFFIYNNFFYSIIPSIFLYGYLYYYSLNLNYEKGRSLAILKERSFQLFLLFLCFTSYLEIYRGI